MKSRIAGALMLFIANDAYAGVGDSMGNFWKGMGGMYNSSNAGAYSGQSAGYYTLGNLYARTPVTNVNPISIQLPSASGSCSDINIFNGAFSFINHEQLIQTLKGISNNAAGFAFQLGIETISPVIAEKMEELQGWIQKINEMNLNSCEAAQTMVGGLWPRHELASRTICSVMANKNGIGNDFVKSRHGCSEDRAGSVNSIRTDKKDAADKLLVEDINIAWKALKDSGFITSDNELAELFMAVSGTIVIKSASSEGGARFEYISSRANDPELITTLLEGGEFKFRKCIETDKCLDLTPDGNNHKITAENAFKAKIEKLATDIVDKIQNDEDLTEDEKSFLDSKTNIPLYKILTVHAAYSGSSSLFELPAYTEAIALQIIFSYLEDILREVDIASDSLIIADDDHLKRFKQDIRQARRTLAERELKTNQNLRTLMTLVDRAMMIEGMLAKNMGSQVIDSFQWSRDL